MAKSKKPTYEELMAIVAKQRQELALQAKRIDHQNRVITRQTDLVAKQKAELDTKTKALTDAQIDIVRFLAFKEAAEPVIRALAEHCKKTLTGDPQLDKASIEDLANDARNLHSIIVQAQAFRSHFAAGGESLKTIAASATARNRKDGKPTHLEDAVEELSVAAERIQKQTMQLTASFEKAALGNASDKSATKQILAHKTIIEAKAPEVASKPLPVNGKRTLGRKKQETPVSKVLESPERKDGYVCSACGTPSKRYFEQVNQFIDITKRTNEEAYRLKTLSNAYFCPHCQKVEFDIPEDMPVPVTPLRSVSLSSIIQCMYLAYEGIPMHRIRGLLFESFQIGNTVIPGAISAVIEAYLSGLHEAIRNQLAQSRVVLSDETSYRVLACEGIGPSSKTQEAPKEIRSKNYVLAMTTGPHCPIPVVYYANIKGRSTEDIKAALNASMKMDVLVTDGYQCYDAIVSQRNPDGEDTGLCHASCNVHLRRAVLKGCDFKGLAAEIENATDIEQVKSGIAQSLARDDSPYHLIGVVEAYQKIYAHEQTLKRQDGEAREDFLKRIQEYRNLHERPLMDAIDTVMSEMAKTLTETRKNGKGYKAKSSSATADAVVYYMNRRNDLRRFLDDPEIPLDTNEIERRIRKLVILRKNNLFEQTVKGLDELCVLYTVIETAKVNGITDPMEWLYRLCFAGYKHCLEQRYTQAYRNSEITEKTVQLQGWNMKELMASFDMTPWLPWNYAKKNPAP